MSVIPIIATAYTVPAPSHNAELTEVGRGTPNGELLRRYCQPIDLSADASDLPREVRVLGENLILCRDKQGRPGVVHPRCVHRGSSLLYGRTDEAGSRCCYHGRAFDMQGRCTDRPSEPQNGLHRNKVRQPWYRWKSATASYLPTSACPTKNRCCRTTARWKRWSTKAPASSRPSI